jgi:hypothetical protein
VKAGRVVVELVIVGAAVAARTMPDGLALAWIFAGP